MAEVAARKQTESEFQNFQTRKYESGWAADELINPRRGYSNTPCFETLLRHFEWYGGISLLEKWYINKVSLFGINPNFVECWGYAMLIHFFIPRPQEPGQTSRAAGDGH